MSGSSVRRVSEWRSFDQLLVGRSAHLWRGLAQQPSHISDIGLPWFPLVEDRPDLVDDPCPVRVRPGAPDQAGAVGADPPLSRRTLWLVESKGAALPHPTAPRLAKWGAIG